MRTQISLPEEQHRKLKHISVDRKISLAELIRRIIRDYLEKENFILSRNAGHRGCSYDDKSNRTDPVKTS